ncbi:MAG: beta-mannosidase [Micromonosporaceae bacterium]
MTWYRPLNDGWLVAPASDSPLSGAPVPATVPGCVHTDLLAAGLVPDPYLDENEEALAWIGYTDWVYETSFDGPPDGADRVDLTFGGLDTVATVELNGVEVGRTANMHRGYRFPVRPLLRERDNRLRVTFASACRYAQAVRDTLGELPRARPEPYNFIRKSACNFGWDWGPTLVTAGIWRPAGLHAWSVARLDRVRPLVTVAGGTGRVEVHVDLERHRDEPLVLTASVGDAGTVRRTVAEGQRAAVLTLTVEEPQLWWPRGYGDQPRYPLDVTLSTVDGVVLDSWSRRVGFRTVRLDTAPDEHGSAFTVVVNDVPVFVRGVNWIPDDTFPSRVGRDRYAARLAQACDANVNYVRVWGGGIYESDDFYDLTDELGLLVGQDFLFACAAYPEDEPLAGEVAAEAAEQVSRLAGHPSLAMWTGNNENNWGYWDWGWADVLEGRAWGEGYYLDLLPRIVAELDPTRPYWPGSPYSGTPDRYPNDPGYGSTHIWDVWNREDYLRYREYRPRFVAEFGYQGPPAYSTLRRAVHDDPLAPDSPGMRRHQKAEDGDGKLRRGLRAHLPEPVDFDDWHFLTQLNQARAVTLGVEHFRAQRPVCMGAIVWQLNDCWPVTSWAAVDGDGRRKPLWHALRRCYADRLLTVQPGDSGLVLVAVNESADPWHVPATATRVTLAGQPRAKSTLAIEVPARSAVRLPLPADLAGAGDPRAEVLVVDTPDTRAWWFFAEDRDVAYPEAGYDASVEPAPGGYRVTVRARTILRDLTLFPDRLDPGAEVDQAMVTLLPGESAVFTVSSGRELDSAALARRPVLRCVNDIT